MKKLFLAVLELQTFHSVISQYSSTEISTNGGNSVVTTSVNGETKTFVDGDLVQSIGSGNYGGTTSVVRQSNNGITSTFVNGVKVPNNSTSVLSQLGTNDLKDISKSITSAFPSFSNFFPFYSTTTPSQTSSTSLAVKASPLVTGNDPKTQNLLIGDTGIVTDPVTGASSIFLNGKNVLNSDPTSNSLNLLPQLKPSAQGVLKNPAGASLLKLNNSSSDLTKNVTPQSLLIEGTGIVNDPLTGSSKIYIDGKNVFNSDPISLGKTASQTPNGTSKGMKPSPLVSGNGTKTQNLLIGDTGIVTDPVTGASSIFLNGKNVLNSDPKTQQNNGDNVFTQIINGVSKTFVNGAQVPSSSKPSSSITTPQINGKSNNGQSIVTQNINGVPKTFINGVEVPSTHIPQGGSGSFVDVTVGNSNNGQNVVTQNINGVSKTFVNGVEVPSSTLKNDLPPLNTASQTLNKTSKLDGKKIVPKKGRGRTSAQKIGKGKRKGLNKQTLNSPMVGQQLLNTTVSN